MIWCFSCFPLVRISLLVSLQIGCADVEIKRHLANARVFYRKIFSMLKVQTLDEAKVVSKITFEEKSVFINYANEI